MKQQRWQASIRPDLTSKIIVLRAYLQKLQDVSKVNLFDVDPSFMRDGVRGDGSRFASVGRYLFPEVLFCTDRNDTRLLFIVLTNDATVLDATPEALDKWLERQERENVSEAVSRAIRVVERAGSRLSNKADQSRVSKAVNALKTSFKLNPPAP